MGGGFRRNSDSELKLKNRRTGSTVGRLCFHRHLSVILFTGWGVDMSVLGMSGYSTPGSRYVCLGWVDLSRGGYSPPRSGYLPPSGWVLIPFRQGWVLIPSDTWDLGYYGIWLKSGRYVSQRNAFLLTLIPQVLFGRLVVLLSGLLTF